MYSAKLWMKSRPRPQDDDNDDNDDHPIVVVSGCLPICPTLVYRQRPNGVMSIVKWQSDWRKGTLW